MDSLAKLLKLSNLVPIMCGHIKWQKWKKPSSCSSALICWIPYPFVAQYWNKYRIIDSLLLYLFKWKMPNFDFSTKIGKITWQKQIQTHKNSTYFFLLISWWIECTILMCFRQKSYETKLTKTQYVKQRKQILFPFKLKLHRQPGMHYRNEHRNVQGI